MSKEILYAWMAGFFDGEGSVRIHCYLPKDGRRCFRRLIEIVNTRKDILEIFSAEFGGQVKERTNLKKRKGSENWKPIYIWKLESSNGNKFAEKIFPYALLKKEHLRLWFDFGKTLSDGKVRVANTGKFPKIDFSSIFDERYSIISRLKKINHRGVLRGSIQDMGNTNKIDPKIEAHNALGGVSQ